MQHNHNKAEMKINWLLIRYNKKGRNRNGLVQNLIIDENLFVIELLEQGLVMSVIGIDYGWHEGEDGKIYDRYGVNYDKLDAVFYGSTLKKLEFYKTNLRNILSGKQCDPYFYDEYMLFLRKNNISAVSFYDKKLERKEEKTI